MLLRASELETASPAVGGAAFSLPWFKGRLALVGGLGAPSYAASLLVEAQAAHELPLWVSAHPAPVYPPDLTRCGVRCGELPFVQLQDAALAFEAAEICLRSQAFGLVVLDLPLAQEPPELAPARLARIAARYQTAVLLLCNDAERYPGGPLLYARITAERRPLSDGRFLLDLQIMKSKHGHAGRHITRVLYGPDGLY